MTANMTALGLETGFETAVPLEGSTLDTLKRIAEGWRGVCDWNLVDRVTPAMVNGSILQLSKDGTSLTRRTVSPREERLLPPFRPDSCDKILGYSVSRKEIDRIMASDSQKVFRQVTLKQNIIPPHLPEGSREEAQKDVPFQVFRKGKERYCCQNLGRCPCRTRTRTEVERNDRGQWVNPDSSIFWMVTYGRNTDKRSDYGADHRSPA
jgi:hypothetical protein